jgi:riboflavin kinase / FMN adenylyltransferase
MSTGVIRLTSLNSLNGNAQGSALAFGNFDGLHLGHQKILRELVGQAGSRNLLSRLLGFYPHPRTVLTPNAARLRPLLSLHQRVATLTELGVEQLCLLRFTRQLSQMSAEEFIREILVERLNVRLLLVGPDAAIGKDREGDVTFLTQSLKKYGAEVMILPFETLSDGYKVGSSIIRRAVSGGDLSLAYKMLGKSYRLSGRVVRGAARGRKIGFPTLNLAGVKQLLPSNGVYIARVSLQGQVCSAAVNIGVSPTFSSVNRQNSALIPKVEAHLLDAELSDMYGERIELELFERIRDEKKFSSVQSLVEQIGEDCQRVRAFFAGKQRYGGLV